MNLEIGYDLDSLFLDLSYDIKLNFPDADANTEIPWGDVASGTAYYYYIDSNGVKSMKSGRYYFNTASPSGAVFSSNEFSVTFHKRNTPSGSKPLSLSVGSGSISLIGGGLWQFENSFKPDSLQTTANIIFSNTYITYNSLSPSISSGTIATASGGTLPDYTTSNIVHNNFPDAPYIPVSGRNMSYNDMRQYVVNEYNLQNPSETINVDDLPAFDDSTEPTNDIQPFSLDYDEILGEEEMESIIAETRYVLDTTPYEIESVDYNQAVSEPYAELKKNAVLDADTKTAISKIYDVAVAMTENDFLPLYAFGAILSIIMWFVFRR